jgi:hypothetical protein
MLISEQFVLRLKHLNLFVAKGVGDHLLERDFLEHIDLHEMQEVAQGNVHAEFFVRYQRDQIDADGDPVWDFTALSELPKRCLTIRFCLSHLKNSSICQRCL